MTKIKLEIKNRWTGKVIFEFETENNSIRKTVEEAIRTGANLTRANLTDANLTGANLTGANLTRADLTRANLTMIKNDFWSILLPAKKEIPGLRLALMEGRVDGSTYSGECCCLVGTIANIAHCDYTSLKGIEPNSNRAAERWFMGIKKGDTPETNQVSKLALEWIDEFEMYLNA